MVRIVNMKRKFIRTLVVVLAALAVFVFVYPDDLWEYGPAGQSEIMKSPEKLPAHRDQHALSSSLLTASSKINCSPSSDAGTMSPLLASPSTRVLRC
jgi:hypothetical protein